MRNTNNINQNYVKEDQVLTQQKLVLKMNLQLFDTSFDMEQETNKEQSLKLR